jgi:nucleoid DNA-binding protein
MNKLELAQIIAKEVELTNVQATAFINAFTETIQKSLKKGNEVTLVGFGTFKVAKRAARVGINPQTKAKMKIPAKKVVKFVVGKALKTAI